MTEGRRTGWEEIDRWFAAPAAGGADASDDAATAHEDDAAPPPEPRCATCGADLEPDQTYCLECGAPTPLAPRLRRGGRNLLVLAGALTILGLGAGALAYAVATDDEGGSTGTATAVTTATGPLVPLPPETAATTGPLPPDTSFTTPDTVFTTPTTPSTTGFDTVTGPGTVTAPPVVTDEPFPEPEPEPLPDPPDTGSSDWPIGTTAWTAILASVRDEADARAAKSRVAREGEPAGVLYSSDFPDLRPGYWVVFSGRFGDRADAIAQATRMRPDFPGAYARRLTG
jgi:hypothetical protein